MKRRGFLAALAALVAAAFVPKGDGYERIEGDWYKYESATGKWWTNEPGLQPHMSSYKYAGVWAWYARRDGSPMVMRRVG